MKITVKLFATLRAYNEKIFEIEVDDKEVIVNVIRALNIPEEEVAIIMVNGRGKSVHDTLEEGDVLALFPPVGGG